jgi:hypothetical protein
VILFLALAVERRKKGTANTAALGYWMPPLWGWNFGELPLRPANNAEKAKAPRVTRGLKWVLTAACISNLSPTNGLVKTHQ